jgi:hypothetical protein
MSLTPDQFKAKFDQASEVRFYARPANYFKWRDMWFEGLDSAVSLKWFFTTLGVEAEKLAPIFGQDAEPEVPRGGKPDAYDHLGAFDMDDRDKFRMLAQLLDKPLAVWRYYGASGETWPLFTIQPNGTVVEAEAPTTT